MRDSCAYRGEASYWSIDGEDIARSYPHPLREAAEVTDRLCIFTEFVNIVVDGTPVERATTPWSRRWTTTTAARRPPSHGSLRLTSC